jgi:hypothetical protein
MIPPDFGFLRLFYTRWHPEPHGRGKIQDGAKHENHNKGKKTKSDYDALHRSLRASHSPKPDSHLIQFL